MKRVPFRRPITLAATAAQTTEFEQAAAEDESTLGPAHPDTLNARGTLARGYPFCGRYAEAIALLEKNVPPVKSCLALITPTRCSPATTSPSATAQRGAPPTPSHCTSGMLPTSSGC